MIDLYTWSTPNGRKASIMLEEVGLPYTVHPVNIGKDEQHAPDFLAISPNNKIPAIIDRTDANAPVSVFESAAILIHLAEKTGQLLAPSGVERVRALEWLSWQIGGLGPMLGQLGYFALMAKEKVPPAIERYTTEVDRLLGVLERRLDKEPYLAGATYSIADVATYPWMAAAATRMAPVLGEKLAAAPKTQAWLARVGDRPAVKKGMAVPQT